VFFPQYVEKFGTSQCFTFERLGKIRRFYQNFAWGDFDAASSAYGTKTFYLAILTAAMSALGFDVWNLRV
jgi:hypothetical protein